MRSVMRRIVPVALAFIVCIALFLTIKVLYFEKAQNVPPVRKSDVSVRPCEPSEQQRAQIESIPSARYTTEAKRRAVVGQIRLSVYFNSNGKVSIIEVVSRLPYGLTGEAIKAAKQIKFKPATTCEFPGTRTDGGEVDYEFPSGHGRMRSVQVD